MASLFICYSRKDIETARRLMGALENQNFDFWIDWASIPASVDWWKEIERGIEEADVFLFLMSPDSIKSKVCQLEIDHAEQNNKRIVPIVLRYFDSKDAPKNITRLNWIFLREQDDFEEGFARILTAVETDIDWLQQHSRLQIKALEWQREQYNESFLLRGKDLQDAEIMLSEAKREPLPTALQRNYVLSSQRLASRNQRRISIMSLLVLMIMSMLVVFGFIQAGRATSFENQLYEAHTQLADAHTQLAQTYIPQATLAFNAQPLANTPVATQVASVTKSPITPSETPAPSLFARTIEDIRSNAISAVRHILLDKMFIFLRKTS